MHPILERRPQETDEISSTRALFSGPTKAAQLQMLTRSHSKSVVFLHPFELKGIDRTLPPGNYRVVTDEELIEELSFPVYRRISTMIFVPGQTYNASVEMVAIDPLDLQAALDRDSAKSTAGGGSE